MSALRSGAMVQAPHSRPSRPTRVACSAKLNQVPVNSKRPVRRQAVVKEDLEGSPPHLVQGSPILLPPAAQSDLFDDLLDLLPVGSAFFGFVAAPILLDLAGVPNPAWWQTFLISVGAGASTVFLGNLGFYLKKSYLSKQQRDELLKVKQEQREELLKARALIVELQKGDNGSHTSAGTFQSPTVYDMISATNNESVKLTKYLQTVAEDIFGEKCEGGVLLGVDPGGKEIRLLLRPGTTVEGVLVPSLKGLVLRVKEVGLGGMIVVLVPDGFCAD